VEHLGARGRPRPSTDCSTLVFKVLTAAPGETPRLADTERLVVLGSVVVLFTTFLLLQLSYFFGNAPVTRESGVTFAEYARQGFAELTTVATLCTILLVVLDRWPVRGPREWRTRAVALVVHQFQS
jgi:hypothetical protein